MYSSQRRTRKRQRLLLAGVFVLLLLLALGGAALALRNSGDSANKETENASKSGAKSGGADSKGKSGGVDRVEKPKSAAPETPGNSGDKPEAVKGIYLTAYSVQGNFDAYLDFVDRTEINAVVIDVKDVTGEVMYPSKVPLANDIGATRDILPNLKTLASDLKERNIYSIARVAVFEDDILPRERPDLAPTDSATGGPWLNNAGQAWSDGYNREVWEYNTAIAKEAAEGGFDEIQFDYIRFPSDGPLDTLTYKKETYPSHEEALAGFLEYADKELEPTGARIAADVFGLAATDDGAGVGQYMDKLAPHLDVVDPMTYPSHYPAGSFGYTNTNAHPYEMVRESIKDFKKDTEKVNPDLEIRPWVQDFDLGEPPYGPKEIKAQMQAVYDSGETGWLLWNAANLYTEGALKSSQKDSPREATAEETTTP